MLKKSKPDVVVLDIALGDGSGLDLIKEISQTMPELPVPEIAILNSFFVEKA